MYINSDWQPDSAEAGACSDAQYLTPPLLLQLQRVGTTTDDQQRCLCQTLLPSEKPQNGSMLIRQIYRLSALKGYVNT